MDIHRSERAHVRAFIAGSTRYKYRDIPGIVRELLLPWRDARYTSSFMAPRGNRRIIKQFAYRRMSIVARNNRSEDLFQNVYIYIYRRAN